MAQKLVDTRDHQFVFLEQLKVQDLVKYDRFADFDEEMFKAIWSLGEQIAADQFYPANRSGDEVGAVYNANDKSVKVPESYHGAFKAFIEAGFPGMITPAEHGGSGVPESVWRGALEYICAGSLPLTMYGTLTMGAANIIRRHGDQNLKDRFLAPMIEGRWGGTMCLTEPEAGSDVGALKTKAVKQSDGSYLLSGNKIFISSGENDLYENIIHLVLARTEGAPQGTRGISIFAVPKFHTSDGNTLGDRNDVFCANIEHKMGIKGSATCTLNYGDQNKCVGYLIGEECQGMKIMFEMMNEARLDVAGQGLSLASAAYQHALAYAKDRVQGYDIQKKDHVSIGITQHADVKRMLMYMKSCSEGMRALTHYASLQMDLKEVETGDKAKEASALLDFLIPILKAGVTDEAWLVTSEAIQVHGGYGYCSEYQVEQYARDSKICAIYEGTNGIQATDLMLRKLLMNPDQFNYKIYRKTVSQSLAEAKGVIDDAYIDAIDSALKAMDQICMTLGKELQSKGVHGVLAHAVPLLKCFTNLSFSWMHIWAMTLASQKIDSSVMSLTGDELQKKFASDREASFYYGKIQSARYWIQHQLPHIYSHIKSIESGSDVILGVDEACLGPWH
ncbi:acyl-CoA dehydrogenase [Pseudobacteriovorax antillogorgiicola]|uniref:3-methylmercaptopropionyl-CoA dehydrogenase n=1 Tax=Pseudobacteriovorax antillogorgiicola TaxID=1513793 RepID=A0A1Y6BTK6_9BACT|nr:acyl-CoA dehydrogenase [Pseudobacteriovorax antillogorgiicola]TCS54609.1 hypothetical protein EDD56_106122 [Pseudobacteriovorax antillogorgiicola]SMF17554.1 hypothetical protein SAMN06296036_106121 [Pseudobacteriovorax antillogorgiicola]